MQSKTIIPIKQSVPIERNTTDQILFCNHLLSTLKKKNLIISEVLERVYFYYQKLEEKTFADEYKSRSNLIGEEVEVVLLNETKKARVLDIDDDLRLVAEYSDGTKEALISADVFKILRA